METNISRANELSTFQNTNLSQRAGTFVAARLDQQPNLLRGTRRSGLKPPGQEPITPRFKGKRFTALAPVLLIF